jgi:hypothetical protein
LHPSGNVPRFIDLLLELFYALLGCVKVFCLPLQRLGKFDIFLTQVLEGFRQGLISWTKIITVMFSLSKNVIEIGGAKIPFGLLYPVILRDPMTI